MGLSGEVRAVSQAGQRVNEAAKLGFTTCVLPKVCADKMKQVEGIRLIGVSNVREALESYKWKHINCRIEMEAAGRGAGLPLSRL